MYNKVEKSFNNLKNYIEKENYKGWDPYDGLNSLIFQIIPFLNQVKFFRLCFIQFFKRCPINFRKIFLIKKDYNPKGLGLFLTGYCNLYKLDNNKKYLEKIKFLIEKIKELNSDGWSGYCWGYNFDWQARAFFQPRYTPTIVASTFIANAILDVYEINNDKKLLDIARSTCDFILKDLNRTYDEYGNFCFSYSPLDKTQVFNASLLGSKLLARVYSHTKEKELIIESKKSVEFCVNHQKEDGSWNYGTLSFHKWVDNFHTGYNLECIYDYQKYSGDESYNENIKKGFDYYVSIFFTEDGISKYYNNKIYPIDIHAPAQLVVSMYRLDKLNEKKELVDRVLSWTIDHMQSKQDFFYYQLKKGISSKIPYMRWAEAWMFYAMSYYLLHFKDKKNAN